jgi:spermidine synthase
MTAFFLSGLASLVFQMIWSRLLHHVFGSSSIAISSVVSVFMGGLGLGAWLCGRFADRLRRPLAAYAVIEIAIGLFALAMPALVTPEGWLADANAWLRRELGAGSIGFALARFACVAPILIVPTTLMGATLPLLARHFVPRGEGAEDASAGVGTLYAVNTFGAVVGVFLAAFVLMPTLGVSAANTCAAGVDILLGIAILTLAGRGRMGGVREVATDPAAGAPQTQHPRRVRIAAAFAFAGSGLCALLYEIVWSRALVNTVGGSVYAFALILVAFLVGIAGGSAISAWGLRGGSDRGTRYAALALSVLAVVPLAVRESLTTWLIALLACIAAIGAPALAARRERRLSATLANDVTHASTRSSLLTLLVPALVAVGTLAFHADRLAGLVLAVVLACALLVTLVQLLATRQVWLLVALQMFIAAATFTSELWADQLALTFASMVGPMYGVLAERVDMVIAIMFATIVLCVLPSALGMGAMFPVTVRVWTAGGDRIARDVGIVYTGNTLGSILGAWLPGFVLMPLLGMQAALHIGISLNLVLALWVALEHARASAQGRTWRWVGVPVAGVVAAGALLVVGSLPNTPLAWNLGRMTMGTFRITLAREVLNDESWGRPDLVYYRDGLATTVSVERWGRHYSLKNNGKVEASNGDDMPTQIMVAAFPLLMHRSGPEDLDVAIIGVGSGVTVGAALQFPVRSVEAVELEPAVIEASRFFADVNHLDYDEAGRITNPRLSVLHDDGRNHLAATRKQYDVIISEPSNPWLTGVSDLFTDEHFRLTKRRLRPGGVYCQWAQLYELSPENVKIIYRTFAKRFRHVVAFSAEDLSSDTVLVGSDAPLDADLGRLRKTFEIPSVAAELNRAYIHQPFDVIARVLLADRDEVERYAQVESRLVDGTWKRDVASTNAGPCPSATCRRDTVPINTDDNVRIEFSAPRDLIGYQRYRGYIDTLYAPEWPHAQVERFVREPLTADETADLVLALLAHGRKAQANKVLARTSAQSEALTRVRTLAQTLGPNPTTPPLPVNPQLPGSLDARQRERLTLVTREAADWLGRNDPQRALRALDALPHALFVRAGPDVRLLRGALLLANEFAADAIEEIEALARQAPAFVLRRPEIYFHLARAHDSLKHFDKAVRNGLAYVDARPLAPRAWADEPPEPPINRAPVSDAEGATEKLEHADRMATLPPGSP